MFNVRLSEDKGNSSRPNMMANVKVVDRRNSRKIKTENHRILVRGDISNGVVFTAGPAFPPPAHLRKYFIGDNEFVIEELGPTSFGSRFKYFGTLVLGSKIDKLRDNP
jgi:hypothetical protein